MEQMDNIKQFGGSNLDYEKFSFMNNPGRGIQKLHKKETMLKKKTPFNEFVQQYNVYRGIVQNEEVMGVKKGAGIGLSSFDSTHSRFP